MVQITKTMQAKHFETLSPYLKDFRDKACEIPVPLIPEHLATFPTRWPFPRGDLYHWITLLNRFDTILEKFCKTYKLDEGPQTVDFGCKVLQDTMVPIDTSTLSLLGYRSDGDVQLIESVLAFSRLLLRSCGNRSLYASSSHLNNLLNSTSLPLLEATLYLGSELAQRYQAAFRRQGGSTNPKTGTNTHLLQSHYNVDLERVQKLATPFVKSVMSPSESPQLPATPRKPPQAGTQAISKSSTSTVYATDLVSLAKGGSGVGSKTSSPKGIRNGVDASATQSEISWEEWGDVKVTYYPKAAADTDLAGNSDTPRPTNSTSSTSPITPTPVRRSSNLGPHGQRTNRASGSEESPTAPSRSLTFSTEDSQSPSSKSVEISSSKLKSTSLHTLLAENIEGLPQELQYELLTKLRVAHALTSSLETRRQILAIRLLAITNLSYLYSEAAFVENALKSDSEEPRRLQLAYQLAELVHPPAEGESAVPRALQTIAFSTLDAIAQHQIKYHDVCAALSTNVNHGVLLYVVRKAVAEMSEEDTGNFTTEHDKWRAALFSLLSSISIMPRVAQELITAGLMPILVEILGLRTSVAERYQPAVLSYLDNIMHNTRDAFTNLVSADGLDTVSNLIVFEVTNSSEKALSGKGMPEEYRTASVDYEIPYFQQQTLKWLFKFIHHLLTTSGGYGGNYDRLLRNLIDSSQLLGSLRQIISNTRCFGSVVWTNAVSILNDFINNEPTSFAVIAEAGLSRGLLEAVTCSTITMPSSTKKTEISTVSATEEAAASDSAEPASEEPADNSSQDTPSDDDDDSEPEYQPSTHRPTKAMLEAPREGPLARGIMPTPDTINIIPQAFGAICLNNAGMKMFQASRALESFFEIFESPEHVKCMDANKDLPSNLGSTFDELVRHHPPLKASIMNAILDMVARVAYLCRTKAEQNKLGAVLWTVDSLGKPIVADNAIKISQTSKGKGKAVDADNDIEMQDADNIGLTSTSAEADTASNTGSMTPYVAVVATFLNTMFSNTSVRSDFCLKGGIEFVLDLADSPCLTYDFASGSSGRILQNVIALLAEQKPHLVMPSLLQRTQSAADVLSPFSTNTEPGHFFRPFIKREAQQIADAEFLARGTSFCKALVNVHSLVSALHACFQNSAYNHRSGSIGFNQVNLSDYYIRLVKSLGPLLGAASREDSELIKQYKNISRITEKSSASDETIPAEQIGTESTSGTGVSAAEVNGTASKAIATSSPASAGSKTKSVLDTDPESPEFKNHEALRQLLRKMSSTIGPFFQILGRSLINKRSDRTDLYQKQQNAAIADALAETILCELNRPGDEPSQEVYKYWTGLLQVLKEMLIDASRHNERPVQTISLVLQAFKDHGGLNATNRLLQIFAKEIREHNLPAINLPEDERADISIRYEYAVAGMKDLLSLYSQIVTGKNVTESLQTVSMNSREGRDRSRLDYFSPPQFLVELRWAVLPTVRQLWESELVEKAPSEISERLIDVIRTIASADNESGAVKRSDKSVTPTASLNRTFKPEPSSVSSLLDHDYERDLCMEALYRCNNNFNNALEYCNEITQDSRQRNPVPDGHLARENAVSSSASRPRTAVSTGTATPDDQAVSNNDALTNVPAIIDSLNQQMPPPTAPGDELVTSQNVDQLLSQIVPGFQSRRNASSTTSSNAAHPSSSSSAHKPPTPIEVPPYWNITVDDLNDERELIRESLIDKCLDTINAHGGVTFEISDLITTVVNKSPDPSTQRKVVGETLVIALMSFAGEEDLRTSGKKVAAYAHLLALMLRDKLFYAAAVGELKENLTTLLEFVKLSPNHSSDEPSPWIAHILLIVEMLLSEDARPRKTKWAAPKDENDTVQPPVLETANPAVSPDERLQLLDAILKILPHIGKDESLALAVLRILVILTRTRSVAQTMGEKKNMQRLFSMAKQLAGASSSRIQSPMMLILRHIIEDEETIKQIMRADIKNFFDQTRGQHQRNMDTNSYLRGLSATAIRAPELFVEITNEMVKYHRWSYSSNSEVSNRSNVLCLKETTPPAPASDPSTNVPEDAVGPTVQATGDLTIQEVKPSTEGAVDSEMLDASKAVAPEHKLPIIENPDGVIHFLLCELLNYKDVDDKEPAPALALAGPAADKATASTNGDIVMTGTSTTPSTEAPAVKDTKKTSGKVEFKAEEHPIHLYRCFILQCLTELLASYNRTKIEFINFKRSAPPQAMTPSKPRSSVVHYLLSDLVPLGTLDSPDSSVYLRKKAATSSWADSVLVALLAKTGEQLVEKSREPSDGEDEPNLLFVRRFVLENISKAYKEASASSEPLDVKYARMLSLADLMAHIMNGKETIGASDTSVVSRSQQQLRRVMFEKGFIATLTASIADVDLNFPGAKEAVRHILKPLKTLTNTAVSLSDRGLVSDSQGQTEEDEIEEATSVSDPEDEREETPDLFRNSTLGMFEPDREDESSSESGDEDEDMYGEEYPEEYDEDMAEDEEDNISEEDEDEGMGPIEGLSGEHGMDVEVIVEEDDDEDDNEDDDEDDDDEEHDSEDDDARVEIIDEAGNIQHIDGEEDIGEWESDEGDNDGEEEDYEGQAQDEDELHDIETNGPLGAILRAVEAGEEGGPLDMLQRMEEQMEGRHGLDLADRMGGDYAEGDDDEEDEDEEDDMEDEEMFLERGYPDDDSGPPPGFGEWEGEVEPMVISHRGGNHRPRGFPPFPLFPGGPRGDPLGELRRTAREHASEVLRPGATPDQLVSTEFRFAWPALNDLRNEGRLDMPDPMTMPLATSREAIDSIHDHQDISSGVSQGDDEHASSEPLEILNQGDASQRVDEPVVELEVQPYDEVDSNDLYAAAQGVVPGNASQATDEHPHQSAADIAASDISTSDAHHPTQIEVDLAPSSDEGGFSLNPRAEPFRPQSPLVSRLQQLLRSLSQRLQPPNTTNHNVVPDFRHSYRSHRPPQPRSIDDGTNPLLQRNSSHAGRDASVRHPGGNWIQAMGPPGSISDLMDLARGPLGGEGSNSAALFEMLRSLPDFPGAIARAGPGGSMGLSFHISAPPGQEIPAELARLIGGPRGGPYTTRRGEIMESGNATFVPQSTVARWSEEAKLLFGPNNHEKVNDLRSAIEAVLVPPAIEADKAQKAAEQERLQKLEEERKKREEEARLAREAKEEEERIEREKKEAEEREARERAEAEALAARGGEQEFVEDEATEDAVSSTDYPDGMDVDGTEAGGEEDHAEEAPAADRPRVTTIIRGNPFDITDLGIDPEFLAELPEEIREEVIMSAVAERRSQAAATGAQPSEIDQEFLNALPEDIRDEIVQQERQDRRRREREEQRRQAGAAAGGPAAGDMDAASILATLPPALRQQVLMEQDEEMLNLLPPELANQARAAQRDIQAHHGRAPSGLARRTIPVGSGEVAPQGTDRPPRRACVQMLDKSGVATLLRLMFTLQRTNLQSALWSVLENICLSRPNRTEVLSTLLHILQDGSADMTAVERSFAHLSLRAKQPKEKDPKTPQPLKRTHTGMSTASGVTSLVQTNAEASPLLVVQQCLGTLHYLVARNLHIPAFFLTEHESVGGLKRTLSRKGKGKETKAAKYAINSLLNLLDRDLIMDNSTVMELLSSLLNQITQPLQALQRKQKESEETQKAEVAPSVTDTAASTTSPEATTDQPAENQPEGAQSEAAATVPAEPATTSSGEPSNPDADKSAVPKAPEKKQRPVTPPVIPEQNLKLVINIFVARECSSKTFRETLSTIKNLSAIPGAKAVFGRELVAKAQELGSTILLDLEELLPQIEKARTGTEIQGVALAKFSPSGSEQGKLLRVLTALDHLFDPKRDKKDKPDEEGESSQLVENQDILSSLYENSTFGPMWEKLSACLGAIGQREHMLNVATILLPLIESLMVVCKNTTLKDAPISRSQMGKEMMLTSPPPESRMESLFFTFTEEHRKILNDLVRNSPKLMSGTFSLLVKNPKVLEFDNKRNYFSRSIHTKSSTSRQSYPPLQLSVRRDQVFHDSFKSLYFQTGDQMKFGKLSIRFHGEEGVDAGGVTREWFQVLTRQMFDPGYALFVPVSSDRTTFHPNQLSSVNEEHLMFFKFIGRIIGKALYEGRVLDCHFSRAVYKRILGKSVSVKDMESLDPEYYKSLVWMLENDITDVFFYTFSVENDKFGVVETIDFIPDGRNIAVTNDNKYEYVRLMVEWKLTGSVKEQLDEFLKGFHDIIPAELIAIFNEQELELLISGLPEIDVDDWKSNTEYHQYAASSPQIQWFWRAVRSYDKEERAKLLQFVTGTSKVPLNGFKELEGMNGYSRFNIHRDHGNKDRLPSSHTCFNQLDLPEYESYEVLRQQVLTAITAGSEYFGFA